MKTYLLFSALLVSAMVASGQQTATEAAGSGAGKKPDLPTGPLLRTAPDFSQWQVVFTYPDEKITEKATPPPRIIQTIRLLRPRSVVTTKTGRIIHEAVVDVADRTSDNWFEGAVQYMRINSDPTWYEVDPGIPGTTNYHPLPPSGFRDMELVQAANFAGVMPFGKGKCLVFTPGGAAALDLSNPDEVEKRITLVSSIAYIDAESRLPIAVRTRSSLRTFHFNVPPTEVQSLPPDLAAQVRKGKEGRALLERPAERPY